MSHHLVRCPFCTKRFNITGISPGTRLRCGGCQAVLTVPGSGSLKARSPFPLKLTAIASGLVVVVVAGLMALRSSPPPVEEPMANLDRGLPMEELRPNKPGEGIIGNIESPSRVEPIPEATWDFRFQMLESVLFNEFSSRMVTYDKVHPYLVAVETSAQYIAFDVAVEYAQRLELLNAIFRRGFEVPLALDQVDEPLVVLVFNSRDSFDAYCLRTEDQRLSPQIKGLYQYNPRRIILYKGADSSSVVLFHEGVHQLVDHYVRRKGSSRSPRGTTRTLITTRRSRLIP